MKTPYGTTVPREIVTILCERYAADHPRTREESVDSYFGAMSKAVYAEYRDRVGSDRGVVSDMVIAECLSRRASVMK